MDFPRLICNSLWIFSYFSRTFEDSLETFETMNNRVWGFSFLFFLSFFDKRSTIPLNSARFLVDFPKIWGDATRFLCYGNILENFGFLFALVWRLKKGKCWLDTFDQIQRFFRDSSKVIGSVEVWIVDGCWKFMQIIFDLVGKRRRIVGLFSGNDESAFPWRRRSPATSQSHVTAASQLWWLQVTWCWKTRFSSPPLFVCLVMYNFKAKKVRAIIVGLMDRFGYQCNDSCMISAWFMQLSSMILGSKRHFRILSLVINRLHYVVNDLSVKRIDSGNFSVR